MPENLYLRANSDTVNRLLALLAILCCSVFSFAQSSQWNWISGRNTISQGPIYGSKGVAAPGNTPGARDGGNSCTDPSGNLWLFGGEGGWDSPFGAGFFNDLWKFDPTTRLWTWVSGDMSFYPSAIYGPIGSPSINYRPQGRTFSNTWCDKQGNIWVFGGEMNQNADRLNDLWKFNPATNEWTLIAGDHRTNQPGVYGTKGVPSTANIPPAMCRAVSWTDNSGMFWLFGGSTRNGTLGDLWRFNPNTLEWTWVNGNQTPYVYPNPLGNYGTRGIPSSTNNPGPRIDAAAWVDKDNNLWLFGGGPGVNLYNDLWKYDPLADQWTWMSGSNTGGAASIYGAKGVAAAPNGPGARYGSVGFHTTDGKLWLFGGYGYSATPGDFHVAELNDLWSYDLAGGQWTWMAGETTIAPLGIYGPSPAAPIPGAEPGGRIWPCGWGDPYNRLWLFGGGGYASQPRQEGSNNDLWGYFPAFKILLATITTTAFCPGDRFQVDYTTDDAFPTGNQFVAQLSDATGSFGNPLIIGSIGSIVSGSIPVTIPVTAPPGTGYRIRVVSKSTGAASADNGTGLTLYGKPTLSLTASTTATDICPGSTVNITASANGGNAPYQYQWSTGSTGDGISFQPTADTTLRVTVSDGCTVSAAADSIRLTVYREHPLQLAGKSVLCPNTPGILNAHSGYASYVWQDGSTDSTLVVTQPGAYAVSVTDRCGKNYNAAIDITRDIPPTGFLPGDTAICSYDQLTLIPRGAYNAYQWSTGETTRGIVVSTPGVYILQIADRAGCPSADTIVVENKDCFMGFRMPSAFTPNGDGHNDRLKPRLFGRVVFLHFTIFNRFGGKVFETTDPANGWNGYGASGDPAPAGTYVWICEYQFAGDPRRLEKGTVIVIR